MTPPHQVPIEVHIVDDDPVSLQLAKERLAIVDTADCRFFSNPFDALDYSAQSRADLYIVDLHQPGLSGAKFWRLLELQAGEAVNVVFVTHRPTSRLARWAIEQGQVLIVKPLEVGTYQLLIADHHRSTKYSGPEKPWARVNKF